MNSTFRNVIFTVIGVAIFFTIAWFFVSLIPYLLAAALIGYIFVKIKKSINNKKNNNTNYDINNRVKDDFRTEQKYYKNEDEKVIDVDFKDVSNK